jgi:hypothetical protein
MHVVHQVHNPVLRQRRVTDGVNRRDPQGLKPAFLLALGDMAETVPFPNAFYKSVAYFLKCGNTSSPNNFAWPVRSSPQISSMM